MTQKSLILIPFEQLNNYCGTSLQLSLITAAADIEQQ